MKVGRSFTSVDRPEARAVVINEALAGRVFGAQSPIGRQLWLGRDAYAVIGVVSDYMTNPFERRTTAPQIFFALPDGARELKAVRFLVRASGDPAALVQPVRRSLRDAVPGLVVSNTFTLEQIRAVARPGDDGGHGAALSAHRHRDAADVERPLRRARIRRVPPDA